jgi:hypothetical protein
MRTSLFTPTFTAMLLAAALSGFSVHAAPVNGTKDSSSQRPPGAASTSVTTNSSLGIEIQSLRASAHGYMIDFRYKVRDPEKAAILASREVKPYMIDQGTGAKLLIPNTPKVGPLRQMSKYADTNKVYYSLFSNPGKIVKPGSKVTVVIGELRVENLMVE